MKLNKLIKILLVFLILAIFMNIVCASENTTIEESPADELEVLTEASEPENTNSQESNEMLSIEENPYEPLNKPQPPVFSVDIYKEANQKTAYCGDTVNFTIKFINNGARTWFKNITVEEHFPEGLKYIGFSGYGWSQSEDSENIFKYNETLYPIMLQF